MQSKGPRTYSTLLVSMANSDDDAWGRFFELYYPMIVSWARHFGCPAGMEDDIFQEVTLSLFQQMGRFEYDPARGSFRGLLKTITRHKVYDTFRRRREYQGDESEDSSTPWEENIADPRGTQQGESMDQVTMRVALHAALRAARAKVTPKTAEIFERYRILDQSPEAVAEAMGVTVQVVYEAVRRFRSDYLAPCYLEVIRELDESVSPDVSSRLLDKALDELVRGQSQFELTMETPQNAAVCERVRHLQETLDFGRCPQGAASWLQVLNAPPGAGPQPGDQLALSGDEVLLGRLSGLGLCLPSAHVSGRHATLLREPSGWYIRDDKSSNGTYVNQQRLSTTRPLNAGDIIQIGDYSLVYLTRPDTSTFRRLDDLT